MDPKWYTTLPPVSSLARQPWDQLIDNWDLQSRSKEMSIWKTTPSTKGTHIILCSRSMLQWLPKINKLAFEGLTNRAVSGIPSVGVMTSFKTAQKMDQDSFVDATALDLSFGAQTGKRCTARQTSSKSLMNIVPIFTKHFKANDSAVMRPSGEKFLAFMADAQETGRDNAKTR